MTQNTLVQSKKKAYRKSTEKCHYNPQIEVRVTCDASGSGFAAALEQNTKGLAIAPGFLIILEEGYSVNELELWTSVTLKFIHRPCCIIICPQRA